ncbi:MAG TPA: cytochrome c-type biogenesis protein CcmH, partial [Candidatus Methylomirabilis sp.]|nr:cytochrome c-type biogenesis protein CcmH [Candidatus Methylomirabilis sp.]
RRRALGYSSARVLVVPVIEAPSNSRTADPPNRRMSLRGTCRAGLILACFILSWAWAPVASALIVSDVAKEFICNCGCNKMLTDCDMQCGEQLRGVIAAKISEGWDKPRIMDLLVRSYGEKLLAAPTKQGFNLIAWITPFTALIFGGVLISLAVGEWVTRRRSAQRGRLERLAGVETKYLDRVDEELKSFD